MSEPDRDLCPSCGNQFGPEDFCQSCRTARPESQEVDPQVAAAMQAIFAQMSPDQDMFIDAAAAGHAKWYQAWIAKGIPEHRAAECLVTMIAEQARSRLSWPWQRAREVRLRARHGLEAPCTISGCGSLS